MTNTPNTWHTDNCFKGVMFAGENDTKGRKLIKHIGYDFGIDKAAYIKTNFTDGRLLKSKLSIF